MPEFRYIALTRDGKEETGTAEYASEAVAYSSLVSLGLTVVDLSLSAGARKGEKVAIRPARTSPLPLNVQADLAEQMALMFAAHLPIGDMLRLLSDSAESAAVKKPLVRVAQLVADGKPFPEAFQTVSGAFSPLFPSLVAVSYASANPALILASLSSYLRKQDQMRSQIGAALVYPIILIIAAVLVVLLLAFYLAPSLAPMFVSLDQPIPGTIGFFLGLREALVGYWMALPAAMVLVTLVATWLGQRHAARLREWMSFVPVIGTVSLSLSLARLTRALELLLSSGRPLAEALRDTATFLRGEAYASLFRDASDAIEAGSTAASVFDRQANLPRMFRELFQYGETTNTLPQVMASLATSLETKAERQTQSATRLIVPALTLIVGGGIALLVYAVMSAVLSVSDLGGV
jgi:general secretion pathway protein F